MSAPNTATPVERLVIVSHVTHFEWDNRLYAYGPYAREIDIWADLFPQVVIAAPCRNARPPADATALTRRNISIAPQIEAGGDTWMAKLRQVLLLPAMAWTLARALYTADAVHVRCPGNLGLLGVCLAPAFSTRLVAKYAGQWPDFPGMSIAARLQKRVLRSAWWKGPVTVYGQWPGQPAHVVPFFTSIMTAAHVDHARQIARARTFDEPTLRVLYVGALGPWKNVDVVVRAVAALVAQGIAVQCDLVGDGSARASLEQLVASLGVEHAVHFVGAVEPARVFDYYEKAHVLVLVSNSEGWPKAVAEAMAFGLICIGSDRGLLPQMLGDGRGFIVQPRDDQALADTLRAVSSPSDRLPQMRARAAIWGQRYSVEDLRDALATLLTQSWRVPVTVAAGDRLQDVPTP